MYFKYYRLINSRAIKENYSLASFISTGKQKELLAQSFLHQTTLEIYKTVISHLSLVEKSIVF